MCQNGWHLQSLDPGILVHKTGEGHTTNGVCSHLTTMRSSGHTTLLLARATATTTATAGGETVTVATPSSQAESIKEMMQQCCDGSWQPLTAWKSKVFINLLQNKVLILSSVRVFMTKCFAFASICQNLSLGGCDRIHLFF